jgi:predicted O-linked N-acetylglucosamine transferase (SPINDLY family)
VLVDLALHIAGNRLQMLARKPAPVQANYFGYPGTSGMRAMDYCIKDAWLDPIGASESLHSERIVRLADCYWCFPKLETPDIGPLPARRRRYVTFGSLCNVCKLNDGVLRLWAQILDRVPNARLTLLVKGRPEHNPHLKRALAASGIAVERVDVFRERATREYLALYDGVDLTLDPFPVAGHTTSLDSLWMGVPVVTLAGRTAMGRAGVSILSTLGLEELIADSPERYIEIAVALATGLGRLAELRSTLRQRMTASPLTDHAKLARNLESLYRQMWVHWCERVAK